MDISVINWKLNELMAKKRIRNKDLATALGITENSVYRLRRTDQMPRLTPERLNGICTFLECQPGELLEWTKDQYPSQQSKMKEIEASQLNQAQDKTDHVSKNEPSSCYSFKEIYPSQMLESA
ncbi:MAG: helix-turn-helix transcriptional regulator [Xenococcaceae cyanobacterium MO_207.B15]|nr:helix-turn-helix transcriptional regulator [Xenococcaceae cyanobacterium MO_207.B15]